MDFAGKLIAILMVAAALAVWVYYKVERRRQDEMFCAWLEDADEIDEELYQ